MIGKLLAVFRKAVLVLRLLFTPRTVLFTTTYYNHLNALTYISRGMRNTPRAIPLIICNGDQHDKIAAIARRSSNRLSPKIKVVYTNNEYRNFTRQKVIKELVESDHRLKYIFNLDDDISFTPYALDDLLKVATPKRMVGFWAYSLKPPFDDYVEGRKRAIYTRCHYLGTGSTLYPAEFYRELKIPEVTEDMMDMEDIWLNCQAFALGYEQYGILTDNWTMEKKLANDPQKATFLKIGFERKTAYWNTLFTPEFIRSKGTIFDDIWRETVAGGRR